MPDLKSEEKLSFQIALLTVATGGKIKRMDVDDLFALSEYADARAVTLAEVKL